MIKFDRKPKRVVEGIPVFIGDRLSGHLKHQVDYFSKEKITDEEEYKLSAWQKSYVKRFTSTFKNLEGRVVLDAGAGSGYMTIELAKKGAHVVCVDLTLRSLIRLYKIAKDEALLSSITFACCDVQNFPFKDESFDYLISNAVLEHLPSDKKAISEINRVCKKSAGLFVAVPLSLKYVNPILIPINLIHDKRIGHLRRYDKETLNNKFKGWNLKKTFYTGHFRKVLKTIVNNLFINVFDEVKIEKEDSKLSHKKYGASNIIAIYSRGDL